jgi:hypothetical protein
MMKQYGVNFILSFRFLNLFSLNYLFFNELDNINLPKLHWAGAQYYFNELIKKIRTCILHVYKNI